MAVKLLLVEDDDGIAAPLQRALAREDYDVTRAPTGADALAAIAGDAPPQLVILDLGLPDIDGLDVCRQARAGGFDGAILILTARGDELDRVVGLDTGADDYMSKPVALAELLARVRALLRRSGRVPTEPASATDAAAPATIDGLRVDEGSRRVFVGAAEMHLSAKEYDLLALLARDAGKVVTRERIMDEVWDEHWFGSTKTLDVTLGRLRSKLADAAAPVEVVAVRGVGFRLESSAG
ncbi:MAG TPA: response regulator transcription factor [Acidimicrobiales bacterium]|nr:response regulator transcription factor [Acidimicrobiales bacterium]